MRASLVPFTLPVGPQANRELGAKNELRPAGEALSRLMALAERHTASPVIRILTACGTGKSGSLLHLLGAGTQHVLVPTYLSRKQLAADLRDARRGASYARHKLVDLRRSPDWRGEHARTEPAHLSTFEAKSRPVPAFATRDWGALQRAMTAILQFLDRLVELLRILLRALPVRLLSAPPPPVHSAPCAVARLRGTQVPRAPQVAFSRFLLAS